MHYIKSITMKAFVGLCCQSVIRVTTICINILSLKISVFNELILRIQF